MEGGADAVSLINTINSITSVDLDLFAPEPTIDGKGAHGGYCGPAVKPIALNMVAEIARDPATREPADQRDRRRDHMARCGRIHGPGRGQRAGLHGGDDLWLQDRAGDDLGPVAVDGRKGHDRYRDFVGRAVPNCHDWQDLNLNYVAKAEIDQDACIKCGRCYAACEDTSHQAISMSEDRIFEVIDAECVACNLCVNVCPVEGCITMERWRRARRSAHRQGGRGGICQLDNAPEQSGRLAPQNKHHPRRGTSRGGGYTA